MYEFSLGFTLSLILSFRFMWCCDAGQSRDYILLSQQANIVCMTSTSKLSTLCMLFTLSSVFAISQVVQPIHKWLYQCNDKLKKNPESCKQPDQIISQIKRVNLTVTSAFRKNISRRGNAAHSERIVNAYWLGTCEENSSSQWPPLLTISHACHQRTSKLLQCIECPCPQSKMTVSI